MTALLIVLHLAFIMGICLGQTASNVSKLHADLLTLNPNVRPVNDVTQPTQVNISFQLMSIISLETASQTLVSNGWMSVFWQNDYMTWDPQDYEGVTLIAPQPEKMWRPKLTVMNTLKDLKPIGEKYVFMNLDNNGLVSWFPGERFETVCELDVLFFPFDVQRCTWQLFIWGDTVDTVTLHAALPYIQLDAYRDNGEWRLVTTKAWTKTITYDGCPMSSLFYEVTLQRRPVLLMLTVLLPPMVLSVANVFVFTIPAEAGERLTYSMTSFLTHGVFMSYIVDLLPSSSQTASLLAVGMSYQLILSAVYVLLCILSLRLFHRDPHRHPVPPTLQTVVVHLELLMCLGPPSRSSTSMTQPQQEVISPDGTAGFLGPEVKGSRLKGHLDRWAVKRKVKQEAYTQPQDMTWQRVSRTLDKLLFRLFLCFTTICATVLSAVVGHQYISSM